MKNFEKQKKTVRENLHIVKLFFNSKISFHVEQTHCRFKIKKENVNKKIWKEKSVTRLQMYGLTDKT